jgi:hypothetical protein
VSQRPDLEVQRRLVQSKLEQFRAMGYEAELDLLAAQVQQGDNRDQMITDLEQKRDNCYAAAKEMATALAALPKPKKEKPPK